MLISLDLAVTLRRIFHESYSKIYELLKDIRERMFVVSLCVMVTILKGADNVNIFLSKVF